MIIAQSNINKSNNNNDIEDNNTHDYILPVLYNQFLGNNNLILKEEVIANELFPSI